MKSVCIIGLISPFLTPFILHHCPSLPPHVFKVLVICSHKHRCYVDIFIKLAGDSNAGLLIRILISFPILNKTKLLPCLAQCHIDRKGKISQQMAMRNSKSHFRTCVESSLADILVQNFHYMFTPREIWQKYYFFSDLYLLLLSNFQIFNL